MDRKKRKSSLTSSSPSSNSSSSSSNSGDTLITTTTSTTPSKLTSSVSSPSSIIRTRSQTAAAEKNQLPLEQPTSTTSTTTTLSTPKRKEPEPTTSTTSTNTTSTPIRSFISRKKSKSITKKVDPEEVEEEEEQEEEQEEVEKLVKKQKTTKKKQQQQQPRKKSITTTTTTTPLSSRKKQPPKMSSKKSSTTDEDTELKDVPEPTTATTTEQKPKLDEDEDEDEEEEEEESNINNNSSGFPTDPSTLQGLMRGLTGAFLNELGMRTSGGSGGGSGVSAAASGLLNTLIEGRSRLKQILQGLKSEDESDQMESLIELCELLSIATEDTMVGFPSDSFAQALINLLNMEHNPEMMLLACRAMSNMLEALPGSVTPVVSHGAVPVLCAKLLSIEYIDLAEQSLQTLEKISLEQPTSVLRSGGLMAVLSYLDFFPTGVQRMAVSTAANICRQVPQDCFETIKDAIPILSTLLTYSDQKVVELSCLCFSRLVEAFYDNAEKLESLTKEGLLPHLVHIISSMNNTTVPLSPATYSQIIRIMANICHGLPQSTLTLLQEGIIEMIQTILLGNTTDATLSRSSQQCYEILALINELLPPLPQEFSALAPPTSRSLRRKKETVENEVDPRIAIYTEHPDYLISFGHGLFVILVDMFTSTVNPSIRYRCLGSICKILYFSTSDMIRDLLKNFGFSSFLAGLLGSRDMNIVSTALKISEMMMEKLPSIFDRYFKREGVLYEIDRLSKLEPLLSNSPKEDDGDLSSIAQLSSSPPTATTPTKSHSSPISIPMSTPPRSIPPPLASSPFGNNQFFVGSPASLPPSTPMSQNLSGSVPTTPSSPPNPLQQQTSTTSTSTTTASSLSSAVPDEMKSTVCKEARKFKEKYFSRQLSHDSLSTDELQSLKVLSDKLNRCYNDAGVDVLQEISSTLTAREGVSAFEFLHSGLVASILSYLTRGDVGKHAECFRKVFLTPIKNNNISQQILSSSPAKQLSSSLTMSRGLDQPVVLLTMLIGKLHDALTKVERFSININEVGGTSSGLKYLAQPFKLKLVKDCEDDSLKDYSSNVVLIEPLATIVAIEEFLTSRVVTKPTTTAANTSTLPSTTANTTTSATSSSPKSGIKEKVVDDDMDDEDDDYHDDYEDDELLQNNDQGTNENESDVHDVKINELNTSGTIPTPPTTTTSTSTTSTTSTTSPPAATSTSTTSTTSTTSASASITTTPPQSRLNQSTSSISTPPSPQPKIAIFADGQRLLPSVTIFQAVQKLAKANQNNMNNNNNNNNNGEQSNENMVPTSRLWEGTHSLKYRYLTPSELEQPTSQQSSIATPKPKISGLGESKLVSFLEEGHIFPLSSSDTTYEIISLIRVLYKLSLENDSGIYIGNSYVAPSEFISQKLTAKVMRQLQDPLALCSGALPDWCKQLLTYCPFLFPFECRRLFFYSTSFGIARALSTLQQRQDLIRQSGADSTSTSNNNNNNRGEVRVGRIQRQKVRIYRNRILESAFKVMELYGKSKSILEVEYFGEVGTGLGPTLEFFTLVSREIQRKDLDLWYIDDDIEVEKDDKDKEMKDVVPLSSPSKSTTKDNNNYVYTVGGLFPKPVRPGTITKKTLDYFKFLGTFVAKAFFDQRLVDIPFSKPFYKYLVNGNFEFDDLRTIAPSLANSIRSLYALVLKIKEIRASASLDDNQKQTEIQALRIGGARVEDLCLDFVLPGFPDWELKTGGSSITVTLDNLEEYINLILSNFLYHGVVQQIDAFKEGFNQIFPLSSLASFSIQEIESLLCGSLAGSDGDWTVESLMESTKCDHGYTNTSEAVQNFFKIMSEFNEEERKQFLLFITGSPHLPIQGFKGLNPRLTIVKKHHNPPLQPDDFLLSVMSCTNYIKLPNYSSKDIMKQKLLYAMKEGQSSFHLS